jgi:hypothetical protein
MSKLQDGATAWLLKSLHDHGNSEITNIMEMALIECPTNHDWQPTIENVSREWRQGTLPINHKKYNGERWATQLLINIWSTLLRLWKQRNNIIYEASDNENKKANTEKLEKRIRRCYSLQTQLTSSERRKWFDTELDDKLQEETQHLKVWLQMVERLLRIYKREQRKRPNSSRIMEMFLGIWATEPQHNPALHPAENHRALPQDMNPN